VTSILTRAEYPPIILTVTQGTPWQGRHQVIKRAHHKYIPLPGSRHHVLHVQSGHVQPTDDALDVYSCVLREDRLRDRPVHVQRGHPIREDHHIVGDVGSVTVGRGEHLGADDVQRVRDVCATCAKARFMRIGTK